MNRYFVAGVAAMAVLTGCGSGSASGSWSQDAKAATPEEIAQKLNELDRKYQAEINAFEQSYVSTFDPDDFVDRNEVRADFVAKFSEIYKKYEDEKGRLQLEFNELQNDFSTSNETLDDFNDRFNEVRVVRTLPKYTVDSLPNTVVAYVNRVIPPYPDADDIARDLVGKKLAEGYGDGYFKSSWRWEVDRGEVSDVKVEVLEQSNSRYSIRASMVLTKGELSMRANVLMYYRLPEGEGWKLDNVVSEGLEFVLTDEYKQFIRREDSYNDTLRLTNIADIPLLVGFVCYLSDGSSFKNYMIVSAQDTEECCYSGARGYKIDFVLRQ